MKNTLLILAAVASGVLLTACSQKQASDYAVVYGSDGQKVAKITGQQSIDYLSNLVGDGVGSAKPAALPNESKVRYHYVLHQVKPAKKIDLYVYPTKPGYVRVKGIPVENNKVWQLSSSLGMKLLKPQTLAK
ncbi:hypothetical protein [Lacticaseibacillus jixiensis]|uniref:hypothetical protein n=1 Tax=Lacticaseibacillus jixiensis TaxID=3231926 RepID=UPI0036F32036